MSVFLSYRSDSGKATCDLMSLVGTCVQWDYGGRGDDIIVPQELYIKC